MSKTVYATVEETKVGKAIISNMLRCLSLIFTAIQVLISLLNSRKTLGCRLQ